MGYGIFRVEIDGLSVAGDGLVQLPLVVQCAAEVVPGRGRVRRLIDHAHEQLLRIGGATESRVGLTEGVG